MQARGIEDLLKCASNPLSKDEQANIKNAYELALNYSQQSETFTGKPYISHALEVAITSMKEIGLGPTSAICSLLHGLVISEWLSIQKVKDQFGESVAEILEGYKKVSELRTEKVSLQSESFRKLFLSMVDDMRVILIRLSHDLNGLRNLDRLKERKQQLVNEVKYLYAPIAHRLGLYKIKTEDRIGWTTNLANQFTLLS